MKHTSIRTLLASLALALALTGAGSANNITVSNVTLTDLDTVGDTVNVKFDVTWENSWRITDPPANWDAAWIFVKFQTGDLLWKHANLDTNNGNHTAPVGGTINTGLTGTRGAGVFLYRSALGTGTASFTNVKLKWKYGTDGVPDNAKITVDVTAIEMVYIPQGAFQVGGGSTTTNRLGGTAGAPFQITGAGPVPCGTALGALSRWTTSQQLSGSTTYLDVPTTFPNGFNAFYCMKYEPSNGERSAAANKSGPAGTVTPPDQAYSNGSEYYLGAELAYLDWAGLRPMTEFEYEKACRGPATPVAGEYAWGNAIIASAPYTLANVGTASEVIATGYRDDAGNVWNANTRHGTSLRPSRVGIFAIPSYSGSASPRIQSGAGYYGVLDLTGNVWDFVVRWTFPASGTSFIGEHGDGYISGGAHNVAEWGLVSVGTQSGGYIKGGAWNTSATGQVSGNYTPTAFTSPAHTARGVRTAP